MIIGNLDTNKQILIIAEIGNNHEGNFSLAEEMIGLAARAGAGAVKFQTIVPEKLVSLAQKERIQQLRKFQLNYDEYDKLSNVAKREGILFLSTPFDLESVDFLEPLVPAYKIASGDNNFYPLIDRIAQTGKPIIVSSGISTLHDIKKTKNYIEEAWKKKNICQELAILHCVVNYPTAPKDANLKAIEKLKELGTTVGYSDHTIGLEAAVLAVGLGARIIEKHFTISKTHSDFHDHKLSMDSEDLRTLVRKVKETEILLGHGEKTILACEQETMQKIRRSVVANRNLEKGTILTNNDLNWVRPGGGLPPGKEYEIVGKKLVKNIQAGEMILSKDVQ